MPPRKGFPTKGLKGAPSNDIGWHFGTPMPNTKGNVVCKLCGKVVKGGITRFKEHIAHKTGNVAPCPNVIGKQLEKVFNHNTSDIEGKNSNEVLMIGVTFMKKGDLLIDQLENIMEKETSKSIPSESEFTLRGAIPELVRSKSSKQPKITSSPWLYNLIQVSIEVGQGVKLLTPYEVSDVYLELEYQRVCDWEFKESKWGQQKSGLAYEAKKIVLGNFFWKEANDLIKVYEPLVKVLRLVDGDEKPTMALFMKLLMELNEQFNKIVDISPKTLGGTRSVIERLEPSLDTQVRMVNQLLLFRDKYETFGTLQAQRAWKQMSPGK
ncbi:hypothetical protein CXB51_028260 [Gossypium anomalum]|uniref:BED-type domain-containing protein n=1 Tax=Gossypium anomalum TaxID=47600 RepID=A0A8J5YYF8_9ROSI|nr:hypothetical protein CXB51_028260 [Gossypium anomalum]